MKIRMQTVPTIAAKSAAAVLVALLLSACPADKPYVSDYKAFKALVDTIDSRTDKRPTLAECDSLQAHIDSARANGASGSRLAEAEVKKVSLCERAQ